MSIDLALAVAVDAENPVAHDLKLTSSQLTFVSDGDAVKQHMRVRFRFFLNEWFLDRREGVPYYRDILVKNPSRAVVTSVFRQVALDTPGVEVLRSFDLTLDRARRVLDVAFVAVLSDGTVVAADFGEFIVEIV